MSEANKRAALILIGNEILSGKVVDLNAQYTIERLRTFGVTLARITVVQDDIEEIANEINRLRGKYDVIITSGGIGPTHDDVTIDGIAKAFGVDPVPVPEIETYLRNKYQERLRPEHLRMAIMPRGAEIVDGGAIGFPTIHIESLYVLPGVPELFRIKLDALEPRLRDTPFFLSCIYLNVDEAVIAQALKDAEAHFDVAVGSYPRFDRNAPYHIKITIESKNKEQVELAVAELENALSDYLVHYTEPVK